MAETSGSWKLVQRAVKGDLGAYERLYRLNLDRVFALCLRLTSDPAQAEELTQAAFIRAWEKLGTFRGRSAFSSWLYRLTVNVVIESQRQSGRRSSREQAAGESAQAGPVPGDPPALARIDLERALAALPQGARRILVLHDVEGYRHREIARLLGISAGTSKSQLVRARQLLRERLDP